MVTMGIAPIKVLHYYYPMSSWFVSCPAVEEKSTSGQSREQSAWCGHGPMVALGQYPPSVPDPDTENTTA